jgi:hypothetical protein
MGWTIRVLGFESRRGLGIFLFTTASRTTVGPTQPPIQWVPGALSLGVKRSGREADHSPPSSAEVKEFVEIYVHSPNTPSWRGAQLKHRDNFTPLPFYPPGKPLVTVISAWRKLRPAARCVEDARPRNVRQMAVWNRVQLLLHCMWEAGVRTHNSNRVHPWRNPPKWILR